MTDRRSSKDGTSSVEGDTLEIISRLQDSVTEKSETTVVSTLKSTVTNQLTLDDLDQRKRVLLEKFVTAFNILEALLAQEHNLNVQHVMSENEVNSKENARKKLFSDYVFIAYLRNLLEQQRNDENAVFIKEMEELLFTEYKTFDFLADKSDLFGAAIYFGCIAAQAIALYLGCPSYGFGLDSVEVAVSTFWNSVDTLVAAVQGTRQLYRGECAIAAANVGNSLVLVGGTAAAVGCFAAGMGAAGVVGGLMACAWTVGMYANVYIEYQQYYASLERKEKLIDYLQQLITSGQETNELEKEDASDEDLLLKPKDDFISLLRKTTSSTVLLQKREEMLKQIPDKTSERYKNIAMQFDLIALENAEAKSHLNNARSWGLCSIAMTFTTTLTILAAVYSGGLSIPVMFALSWAGSAIGLTSAGIRTAFIGHAMENPVDKVNKAIQLRDKKSEKQTEPLVAQTNQSNKDAEQTSSPFSSEETQILNGVNDDDCNSESSDSTSTVTI